MLKIFQPLQDAKFPGVACQEKLTVISVFAFLYMAMVRLEILLFKA